MTHAPAEAGKNTSSAAESSDLDEGENQQAADNIDIPAGASYSSCTFLCMGYP